MSSSYGLVFSNTGHCGTFVQRISFSFRKCLLNFSDYISHLHSEKPSALPSWVEHVRRRKKTDIIDFSIYTPNRDFRIVQSAKFVDLCKRHLFVYDPVLKRVCPHRVLSVSEYKKSLANVLQSPVTPINILLFGKARMNITSVMTNQFPEDYHDLKPSEISNLFPRIMEYFQSIVSRLWPAPLLPPSSKCRHERGYVNWASYRGRSTTHKGYLVISILKNKFCTNVMRSHKSNGIYFVLDLQTNTFIQKCHDRNCCNY